MSQKPQNLWLQIKSKFSIFCKHSTLHGVYYLAEGSRWMHAAWILIIIASLGLCCFLSHMIWDKFNIDPTLTVVETTHYSTADIPFPAVTVCDPRTVYSPSTENITNLLTLRGYNQSQIAEFYQSFADVKNANYTPSVYVKKMHYLLDDLGYPLMVLLDMFKKPCDEILLECYWRSKPHNCSEMFRSVFTVVGFCCQFDIPYFKLNTLSPTSFISGVESTEALDIIVKSVSKQADRSIQENNIMMYVFDQKDRITLIDNAIIITPAAYFDVNVYLWAIDSSVYVKALSLMARKCILDSDPGIGVSFYQGCLTRLILKQVVEQCRCLPFKYTAKELNVESFVSCTWDRLVCVYQAAAHIEADMREIIAHNECYQRCDYVQYETEVEYIKKQRNLRKLNEINSRVTVHFSETTCMKYRREVLYTWDQMLANLGGIFGLCLGGSIISVIEIIWFLFEVLYTSLHGVFTKKVKPKEKEKIFTVNKNILKRLKINEQDVKLGQNSTELKLKFAN